MLEGILSRQGMSESSAAAAGGGQDDGRRIFAG